MKPREPPAEPIVATITISVVVILVFDRKKIAKKNSAAIVGPSSITPNDSVRYEFMAHSTIDSARPAIRLRTVRGGRAGGAAVGSLMSTRSQHGPSGERIRPGDVVASGETPCYRQSGFFVCVRSK